MIEDSKVRRLIWDSMLSADLNQRYFRALASLYQRQDRAAKIVVAIATSAAVSGWWLWGTAGFDWVWQTFSVLAAAVAIALPIWDPARSMKTASALSASWFAVMREYELLWAGRGGRCERARRPRRMPEHCGVREGTCRARGESPRASTTRATLRGRCAPFPRPARVASRKGTTQMQGQEKNPTPPKPGTPQKPTPPLKPTPPRHDRDIPGKIAPSRPWPPPPGRGGKD